MLETLFLPLFLQTLAVVTGFGAGALIIFLCVLAVLIITYPITRRYTKN